MFNELCRTSLETPFATNRALYTLEPVNEVKHLIPSDLGVLLLQFEGFHGGSVGERMSSLTSGLTDTKVIQIVAVPALCLTARSALGETKDRAMPVGLGP